MKVQIRKLVAFYVCDYVHLRSLILRRWGRSNERGSNIQYLLLNINTHKCTMCKATNNVKLNVTGVSHLARIITINKHSSHRNQTATKIRISAIKTYRRIFGTYKYTHSLHFTLQQPLMAKIHTGSDFIQHLQTLRNSQSSRRTCNTQIIHHFSI